MTSQDIDSGTIFVSDMFRHGFRIFASLVRNDEPRGFNYPLNSDKFRKNHESILANSTSARDFAEQIMNNYFAVKLKPFVAISIELSKKPKTLEDQHAFFVAMFQYRCLVIVRENILIPAITSSLPSTQSTNRTGSLAILTSEPAKTGKNWASKKKANAKKAAATNNAAPINNPPVRGFDLVNGIPNAFGLNEPVGPKAGPVQSELARVTYLQTLIASKALEMPLSE